ncbi:uncharacterized protein LOC131025770 [Salvia miltiorrhiza]|uniref:uncharacterized protein LOC131025770 n=1 Tax=Salvia miltiorrhiza TaxID=226208 RepID=UPI0025AD25DD|nr:uncharacterized protein LOC131025770 [Salvia miltiorrhiza]
MAMSFAIKLLLLVALTTAASLRLTSAAETLAPSQPPSPATAAANQDTHLRNILDALIGSGDYGGWANLLSSANPSELPVTATFFIPSDDAISGLLSASTTARLDPLLVPYHIVPQRLTFSELQHLDTRTRLPTLLPANFIVVTNNSATNFTVDGSQITQADIFLNAAFALHGVNKVLNYSLFALPAPPASLLRKKKKLPRPRGITVSAAWRSCATLVSTFFMLLIFNIL